MKKSNLTLLIAAAIILLSFIIICIVAVDRDYYKRYSLKALSLQLPKFSVLVVDSGHLLIIGNDKTDSLSTNKKNNTLWYTENFRPNYMVKNDTGYISTSNRRIGNSYAQTCIKGKDFKKIILKHNCDVTISRYNLDSLDLNIINSTLTMDNTTIKHLAINASSKSKICIYNSVLISLLAVNVSASSHVKSYAKVKTAIGNISNHSNFYLSDVLDLQLKMDSTCMMKE